MRAVTVAICTYNRPGLLRRTLAQLAGIPHPADWELVVVNNDSPEPVTERVIAEFAERLPIRAFVEKKAGVASARNRALDEARGELIVWTDDDVLVDPAWLETAVAAFARWPDTAVLGGPIAPWFEAEPDPDMAAAFPLLGSGFGGLDHALPEGPLDLSTLSIHGANFALRRSAIGALRFDADLGHRKGVRLFGEETRFFEQVLARGGRAVWVPGMRVRHFVPKEHLTLEYVRSFYKGRGRTAAIREEVFRGPRWLGVPRWVLRAWVSAALRYALRRLLRSRRRAFEHDRALAYYAGVIEQCRLHR